MSNTTEMVEFANKYNLPIKRVMYYRDRLLSAGYTEIMWEFIDPIDVMGLPYIDKEGNKQIAESKIPLAGH